MSFTLIVKKRESSIFAGPAYIYYLEWEGENNYFMAGEILQSASIEAHCDLINELVSGIRIREREHQREPILNE